MNESAFALIYSALLSSRSTGTCTSPRSAVKIIVECMHDKPVHASKGAMPQNVPGGHVFRQYRHDVHSEKTCTLKNTTLKGALSASRSKRRSLSHPRPPAIWNPHFPSTLLRLSNLQSLSTHYSDALSAGIRRSGVRAAHSDSSSLSLGENEVLRPFRACISSPSVDMEAVWEAFEVLRLSDNLPILPDDEFLNFVPRAYRASLLSVDPPAEPSKETAARLGRLHDEVLRRAKNAAELEGSKFRAWLDVLSLQTLILAGKVDKARETVNEAFMLLGGHIPAQNFTALQQLFIASILRDNLEAGLLVLAKVWPCIRQCFRWYLPAQGNDDNAEELRRSVSFAFKAVKDGKDFVSVVTDEAAQAVGIPILAFVLCAHESVDKIHAVHREFVSVGLPLSLDTHIQFFKALLAGGGYARAYDVRNRIFWKYPASQGKYQVSRALRLFPDVEAPEIVSDALSYKAETTTKARFSSCIKNTSVTFSELLSVWGDVEASNCIRRSRGGQILIYDYDIRVFAKLIIDNSCAKPGDLTAPNAKEAIFLLDQVTEVLKQRYQRYEEGVQDNLLLPLHCHSMILKGNLLPVRNMILKERKGHLPDRTRTIAQLLLASLRVQTISETFEHLNALWPMCVRHVDDATGRFKTQEMSTQSERLRDVLFGMCRGIKDPATWIADNLTTTESQTTSGHLFSVFLREQRDYDTALKLFNGIQTRKLPFSSFAHLVLMKLFIPDECDVAGRIYRSLHSRFPEKYADPRQRDREELYVGIRMFSLQGDVQKTKEYFDIIKARGYVDRGARWRLLHAYSINGNTQEARKLFSRFFDGTLNTPSVDDFRALIYCHVRAGDMEGINYWLDEMHKNNIRPNVGIFNMVLLAFATSLDLDSAIAVMQRMRENKMQPNHISYSTVMYIMAEKKDPVAAEQLYQRALDEGVVPDDIMIFTLMNAHVEAGSWQGVIRAFDYLQRSPRPIRLTVQLYNVLLKAYVLIGAPFKTVSNIFRRYTTLGMEPSDHTYALLIQSACDAGRMDTAVNLFKQLEALTAAKGSEGVSYINVYVMTIIMAGFLRMKDKERAMQVYEDMQTRAIQPSSITFGVIINSYANEGSEESLKIAEEFMSSLLSAEESQRAWIGSSRGGRTKALTAIFGPLMSIYGRELDVSAVEKHFDEMLAAGGQPTMISLTMLMDAYRRVNNLEGVEQIWAEIVAMARQATQNDPFARLRAPAAAAPVVMPGEDKRTRPRQANLLCLPLSVYITALSNAGRHTAIARTWREVKEWGFVFDAHNWNHLAAALVRAGEPERAFEVLERVVLPFQRRASAFVRGRGAARTPLTYVGRTAAAAAEEEEEDELPQRDPRTPSRREETVRSAVRHAGELTASVEDPAQPLHELQQLSLSWHAWRPHRATLDVLNGALERLEAGLAVRPEGQPLAREDDVRRMSTEDAAEHRARERAEAAAILHRIHQNYPNTMQLVEQREGELQRLWRDDPAVYS